jgi:hypothetical protein
LHGTGTRAPARSANWPNKKGKAHNFTVYLTTSSPSKLGDELSLAGYRVFEALALSEVLYLQENESIDVVIIAADVEEQEEKVKQLPGIRPTPVVGGSWWTVRVWKALRQRQTNQHPGTGAAGSCYQRRARSKEIAAIGGDTKTLMAFAMYLRLAKFFTVSGIIVCV